MATPNDPYASIAQPVPPPQGSDPYASIATKVSPGQLDALRQQNATNDAKHFSTSVSANDDATLEGVATAGQGAPQAGNIVGAAKSFLEPATTIAKLIHSGGEKIHEGLGEAVAPQSGIDRMENATEARTPEEHAGGMMETIAEFALGDEALKTLTLPQKLSKIAPVLKAIEKHPKMVKALSTAIRQGTVATAQGAAHGEDAGTALEQGAITGGLGLAFEGLSAGAKSFLEKNRSTLEKVGGVDTVIPAEVRNAKPTPQQAAGQESIRNAAQETTAQHLDEVNASRRIPSSPPMLPARTGPFEFQINGVPPTEAASGSTSVPAAEMPRSRITGLPEDATKPHIGPDGEIVWPGGRNYTNTNDAEVEAFKKKNGIKDGPQRWAGQEGQESESARNVRELGSTSSATPARLMRDQPYMTSPAEGAEPHSVGAPQGGGVIKTTDAQVAKSHLANLNEIINHDDFASLKPEQQKALLGARDDIQSQLTEYHKHMELQNPHYNRPNFPQVDVPRAIQSVGSYTDAAKHIEKIATDGYNSISDALQLNDISGGKFATIRNANRAAWDAYKGASSVEAMHAAELAIDETNKQMQDLLMKDIQGAVSPAELDGFNRAYGSAQKLKYVAHAVDGAFSGNPGASVKSWEYRGFDGNKLMSNLNRLETKFGRASLERTVGRQQLETLYKVAELNRTGAARARFGVAMKPIAEYIARAGSAAKHLAPIAIGGEVGRATGIGWGAGALAGETMALATKKVMNAILTNPKVAQNLIFAIESGARPQHYGPLIGAMVQQLEKKDKKDGTE